MEEIIRLTKELMRFKTTQDNPEDIKKCADFMVGYLSGKNILVKTFEKNLKISIVATLQETKTPDVFFNAHFDVVPGSSHAFEPLEKDGFLYGRGSIDCKIHAASLLFLIKQLAKLDNRPNVGIMLTSDEEVQGHDGVEWLLNHFGYGCKFALVADGGDNLDIVLKHKGVLQLKVSARGKSAHSSEYWNGENAIENLLAAKEKIFALFPKISGPEWKTTLAMTKVSAGDAVNQIPDYASMHLDIRYTEEMKPDDIIRKIESCGVDVEVVGDAGMLDTQPNDPYIKKLSSAIEKATGKKPALSVEHGATDARFFFEKGIPAVLFRTIGGGEHSENEHLETASVEKFYSSILEFAKSI